MNKIPTYAMRATLDIEPYTGDTEYGPGYCTLVKVRAHLQPKRRIIKISEGVEIVCTAIAYIAPQAELKVEVLSRVSYQGKTYTVRGSEPYQDSYVELTLEPKL